MDEIFLLPQKITRRKAERRIYSLLIEKKNSWAWKSCSFYNFNVEIYKKEPSQYKFHKKKHTYVQELDNFCRCSISHRLIQVLVLSFYIQYMCIVQDVIFESIWCDSAEYEKNLYNILFMNFMRVFEYIIHFFCSFTCKY